MNYSVIRSRRRTLSIEIDRTGNVKVRAPYRMPNKDIKAFITEKKPQRMPQKRRLPSP